VSKTNSGDVGQNRGADRRQKSAPVVDGESLDSISSPLQPQLLSRINEALVLRTIRQQGPLSRVELSQRMGATFPTVAKAVGSLVGAHLLEEFEHITAGPGRPAKRLRLSKDRSQVVGIVVDVGTCEVASAGFDGALRVESRQSFATPKTYPELLEAICARVNALATGGAPILCVGVSVAGLIDYHRQEVSLVANMPFLDGKRLGHDLGERLAVDCLLIHDTHALCLAEYVHGDASNFDTFLVLDLCPGGLGMGAMVNHMLITGHSGFAGEMGHAPMIPGGRKCRCGRRGCLETVASEWVLLERVGERLGRPVEFGELISLALGRDKLVRAELNRLSKYFSMALAQVVNMNNPQAVYLAGRLFDELPWLRGQVVARAKQMALAPAYKDCQFLDGNCGQLLGAIAAAISAVTSARVDGLQDTLSGLALSVARRSVS
jgi:predicted NBD/HSP70 family sugar kinase